MALALSQLALQDGGLCMHACEKALCIYMQDGTVFDSSVQRGEPISFELGAGRVIRGWDEGVAGMVVGGTRQLVIPSHLGYGARGAPPAIPPNALLHFDLELVEIDADGGGWGGWLKRLASIAKALPFR
jgi:hypothetical protein